jgi:hypothetical protein
VSRADLRMLLHTHKRVSRLLCRFRIQYLPLRSEFFSSDFRVIAELRGFAPPSGRRPSAAPTN